MGTIIKPAAIRKDGAALMYGNRKVGLVCTWKKTIKLKDASLKNAVKELFPEYTIIEKLEEG